MTTVTNFTIEQIKTAHAKIKSGADFPKYIQEIKKLGVTLYETYVADGHTDYYDSNNNWAGSGAKYSALLIADETNADAFRADLSAHQQGKTDYMSFCKDCATCGIEKWVVRLTEMTCAYYDKRNNLVLVEDIPE